MPKIVAKRNILLSSPSFFCLPSRLSCLSQYIYWRPGGNLPECGVGGEATCLQEPGRPCAIRENDEVPHGVRGTRSEPRLPSRLAW